MRPRLLTPPLLLALCASACTAWRTHPLPAGLSGAGPAPVRPTRTEGRIVMMRNVRVEGDSAVGRFGPQGSRAVVAVADASRVQRREYSPLRTLGALAGGYVAVAGVFLVTVLTT